MSLQLEGVEQLTKAIQNVAIEISDPKLKRKINRKAAKPIVKAAREIAPELQTRYAQKIDGKLGKVRYGTPKAVASIRAPRNKGVRIATYLKGNLAGAIRVLALRKAISAIVGPFVKKRGQGQGVFGPGTRKFDAYYAQMVYGSAKAFQRRVMIKALQIGSGQSVKSIEDDLRREIKSSGRKNGLEVK